MGIVGVDVGQQGAHHGRHSRAHVLGGEARKVPGEQKPGQQAGRQAKGLGGRGWLAPRPSALPPRPGPRPFSAASEPEGAARNSRRVAETTTQPPPPNGARAALQGEGKTSLPPLPRGNTVASPRPRQGLPREGSSTPPHSGGCSRTCVCVSGKPPPPPQTDCMAISLGSCLKMQKRNRVQLPPLRLQPLPFPGAPPPSWQEAPSQGSSFCAGLLLLRALSSSRPLAAQEAGAGAVLLLDSAPPPKPASTPAGAQPPPSSIN